MMSVACKRVFPLVCLLSLACAAPRDVFESTREPDRLSSIDIDISQQIVLESTNIRNPPVCVITIDTTDIGQQQVDVGKVTGPCTNTAHDLLYAVVYLTSP